ncbi:hypothetical protein UVI_02055900 [Ustilaginoidea virens]|uniref:Uncharacterized protein n=1 Tax=Ustilaginoidea virens TaxID=1159556 RepID=A0A1B5KY60_USTVR|nr:hypothetical protein UVI_02055900 [Ustilaginoidea virens]
MATGTITNAVCFLLLSSRIVNLVVATITVLGGITEIFSFQLQYIILGTYMIVFGLAIALLVYILIGGLLFGTSVLSNIAGGIVCITGLGYVGLEFIPSIEPPNNMREADGAGWGAEQV